MRIASCACAAPAANAAAHAKLKMIFVALMSPSDAARSPQQLSKPHALNDSDFAAA
jgi:hypothetical protein